MKHIRLFHTVLRSAIRILPLCLLTISLCIHKPTFTKNHHTTHQYKQSLQANDSEFWFKLAEFPFSNNFKWGCATSALQIEGTVSSQGNHCKNSWTIHQDLGQPGTGCDHWNRYKEDIKLMKQLGINSYRFSIEWSKVQPEEGIFDQEVINHYIDLCNELIKNNIEPIPCLFHHAWPEWFGKKGGFEKAKNIKYFVQFARHIFDHLIHKNGISMWMTFNEPVGYALKGWFRAEYPPFKNDLKLCGTVVKNMLNAHVAIYRLAKQLNPQAQIGFSHIFQPLDPYHNYNPLELAACWMFNYLLQDAALEFFKTGKFSWYRVSSHNKYAKGALDYIGVNYYTHTVIKHSFPCSMGPAHKKNDKMMGNKAMHPKGLYDSIKKAAKLGIPIYITENGISDPEDIWKDEYMREHLAITVQAIQGGYDIRGYFWWTLMDCFEWSKNAEIRKELKKKQKRIKHPITPIWSQMGLYAVNSETKERTLRPGAQNFVNLLHILRYKNQLITTA